MALRDKLPPHKPALPPHAQERLGAHDYGPFWSKGDEIHPKVETKRLLTITFGNDGIAGGDATTRRSTSLDQERIYEVRLERIWFKGILPAPTDAQRLDVRFKGSSLLPHPQGYGQGEFADWITLLGADLTMEVEEFRHCVVAEDTDGRIKFGFEPKIEVRDSTSKERMNFETCTCWFVLTTRKAPTNYGGAGL